jgi:hypothetical protein
MHHRRLKAKKALGYVQRVVGPAMVKRAADAGLPNDDLTPAERAVRAVRQELLDALGPDPTPGQRILVDGVTLDTIVLQSIQSWMLILVAEGGLVDTKRHAVYPIVNDVARLHSRIASRLKLLNGHIKRTDGPTDAFERAMQMTALRRKRKPKGVSEGRGGGVVTPPPSVDSKLPADQISPPPTNGSEGEK